MAQIGLSPDEELQIKTICEYLFFDQYKDYVTYNRFEQCFQPLFNNVEISIDQVFKSIVGPKKKYLNYPRFINSYLNYKNNQETLSPYLKLFFEKLFNSILKKENTSIGKPQEKTFNFCTPKTCKRRDCLSEIKILSDNEGSIHGLILEYDNIVQNKMYPIKLEQNLVISLEMKLGILDDKIKKDLGKLSGVKEEFCKDAVTHIFGTMNQEKGIITFLGFKCVSGKTLFVGYPNGDGFLFGQFGKKFHEIKLHNNLEGINFFFPGFNKNIKTNYYLSTEANKINKEILNKDILIQDEVQLSQLNDEIQIDKMITTPIIEENHFFDEKLLDEIDGNDYKEIVNLNPREWILKTTQEKKDINIKPILTVDDALKEIEKEKEKSQEIFNKEIKPELMAKGRRKGKQNKKRNQRGKNGKLHEIKNLNSGKKSNVQKWDGKKETAKNIKPIDFLKSKENFAKLKSRMAKSLHNELSKLKKNFDNNIAQNIINKIIPNDENKTEKRANKSVKQKKLKKLEKKEKIEEKIEEKKEKTKKRKLIIKTSNGEQKKVFTLDELKGRAKSVQKENKPSDEEIPVTISDDNNADNKYNNLFCSDAQILVNAIERIKTKDNENSGINVENILTGDNLKQKLKAKKNISVIEKWKFFGNKMKLLSGPLLLKTLGAVLKSIRIINDEIEGKKIISLQERLKLFQILDENECIVDFLSKDNEEEEENNINDKKEEENIDNIDEEDLLIPSDHPEEITNLTELEKKIDDIDKLLNKKGLKLEDKKKLEKLRNLYLQQKNIIIENKTEKAKYELINQNNIDINKYLKEEQEKREKAKQEAQKKLEEEIKKEQSQIKEGISVKDIKIKADHKIFRNQPFYVGTGEYTDPLFKPEKSNLCPYNKKGEWILPPDGMPSDVDGWKDFEWCRVQELFDSENYSVFSNGVAVEDIIQSNLGDCYFLSAIGSLCKFPKLIENLFYFKEKTKEHIYGIYFYINGIKKLVLIDDYLPCISSHGYKRFAMGKSEEDEIWVALIEKAFAKINGSYIRIGTGGTPNEVFDVFTEAYSEEITVDYNNEDELWKKLIDGFEKGFVMTAGTSGNGFVEEVGLDCSHAYTVLGIYEINGEKVIRLRNPYGNGEFNGDWSDYSKKWTEDLKKKYNYYEKDDGDFFMGYKDFLKYFIIMGIAKLHLSWSSTKLRIRKSQAIKCQLIKVTIPNDNTLVYFQLYSKNPRIPYKNGEYPNPVLSNIILADKDFNYINGTKDNKMHICVEETLNKGVYYLFVDSNFRFINEGTHGYTVTAYSKNEIPLENITEKNDVNKLLHKTMIDYCKKKFKPHPQKNGINFYANEAFDKNVPYRVLVFENTTDKDFGIKNELISKGEKSCSFYCDEFANEKENIMIKNIKGKETVCEIIMYHSLSSLFEYDLTFTKAIKEIDKEYNHEVFNEEAEIIDKKGKLKQYFLEKDDNIYIIGISNDTDKDLKFKLILEGLKINNGEYKNKSEVIFELKAKKRKIFETIVIGDDDLSFEFQFA